MRNMPKNTISPFSLMTCGLGLGLCSLAMPAIGASEARIESFIAYQDAAELMMVSADRSALRCGDQDVFYTIAELSADTALQTVGVSGSYTKVLLPDTIGGFVPINEAELSGDSKSVVLTVESKLRAPSHLLGISGSWKAIYAQTLPKGTSLAVIEVLSNDGGAVVGYRVVTPTSPTGELPIAYIKTSALRSATAGEIQAFAGGQVPAADKPVEVVNEPIAEPTAEPVAETVIDTPADTATPSEDVKAVDRSLMEEMNTSTGDPIEIVNTTPRDVDAGAVEDAPKRAIGGQLSVSMLEDLEAAFDSARSLSKTDLDSALDELFAEFTRSRAKATAGTSTATALDQRLEWLDIRMESRDQRLAIAAMLAAYDANADQVAKDIQAWQAGRAYQLVGRMVTSAIYTGEHLPLLYRIQATDPATGASRTIGYVAPKADQDFRHLLGRVVGVIGVMNADESLRLTVIDPDRIEPMPQ